MVDLDALYREHADTVHRYLMVKTGSADLAEELTQETFFQALRTVDSYDEGCKFSTWLIGIAKNVLRTHWAVGAERAYVPLRGHEPSLRFN